MKPEQVKHGQRVQWEGFEWEVLDRSTIPAHWYLHRRDAKGTWRHAEVHPRNMILINQGARVPEEAGSK